MNEIQSYNTLFVPLKSANIITIMFLPIRIHQYSSESEIPSMSHHFQILSLCERKNLRDLCRESNPGPLNYMSRAHYLYHWIRDLDLASSFLKQPKTRDFGVHFPKIFWGRAPDPLFLAAFGRFAPAPPPPSQNIFLRLCYILLKYLLKTVRRSVQMCTTTNINRTLSLLLTWLDLRAVLSLGVSWGKMYYLLEQKVCLCDCLSHYSLDQIPVVNGDTRAVCFKRNSGIHDTDTRCYRLQHCIHLD